MYKKSRMFKRTQVLMGTFVSIQFTYPSTIEAYKIMNGAFEEMQRVAELMNTFNDASEISTLNRQGFYKNLSIETMEVIRTALYYSRLSDGLFDISILPVLKIRQEAALTGLTLEKKDLSKAYNLVDYRNIVINGNSIRFAKKDMRVTLGGIAKGFVVDTAIEFLKDVGVKRALVNGGGDIRVMGGTKGNPWKIGIKDPMNRRNIVDIIQLYEQAVASSGTYQRDFNDIIEPEANIQERQVLASTVVTEKAIDADVLATCMLIMGIEKGLELIEAKNNIAALLVSKEAKLIKSNHWSDYCQPN